MARPSTGLQWLGWADSADDTTVTDRSGVGTAIDLTVIEVNTNPVLVSRGAGSAFDYDNAAGSGRINSASGQNGTKIDLTGKTCTIEVWLELDAGVEDGEDRRMMGASDGNTSGNVYKTLFAGETVLGNESIGLRVRAGGTLYTMLIDLGTQTDLESSAHHLVVVLDTALASGRMTAYLDNSSVGTSDSIPQDATINGLSTSGEFSFGSAHSSGARQWRGYIWKGSFYSTALSSSEVTDLYNLGEGPENVGTTFQSRGGRRVGIQGRR